MAFAVIPALERIQRSSTLKKKRNLESAHLILVFSAESFEPSYS